ncbi:hypothetical protein ABPG74_020019 [Tetrahymena malaccensis]
MQKQNKTFKYIKDFLEFKNKRQLTKINLALDNYPIENEELIDLSLQLCVCSKIKLFSLSLTHKNLQEDQMLSFFGNLQAYKILSTIWFDFKYNRISNKGISFLAQFLIKCVNLKQLYINLHSNNIDINGAFELLNTISSIKSIQSLEIMLGENKLQLESRVVQVCNLSNSLTSLHIGLNQNSITDKGVQAIGVALSSCIKLNKLELYFYSNKIGDIGVSAIASSLKKLTLLKKLKLSFYKNMIQDNGIEQIGQALSYCTYLTNLALYLNDNQFGDKGTFSLAEGLSHCTDIKTLKLSLFNNRQITNEGYQKFDYCLQILPDLYSLKFYFSNNEKLLKSKDLLNCSNIRILTLDLQLCSLLSEKNQHKRNALKIRRLVILNC